MSINANFPNVRPSLLLDFANSQQLDPRVTFSRSTTAPYYGTSSVLAEQNLLLQSQALATTPWSTTLNTITNNSATAPDGTTTASFIVPNTSTSAHSFTQATNFIGIGTFSFYAKAGAYSYVGLASGPNNFVYFDLTNANISTLGTGWANATCTAVGNGWYRCTATNTTSQTWTQVFIYPVNTFIASGNTAPSYAGDGTSGIYVWGCQLEQRSSVTAYNATTTTAITNYIPQLLTAPINAPRFDFNPTTGESLGLLIEQSSTNLLTYSQLFNNAIWNNNGGSVSINTTAGIAPDGTQTANLVTESTGTTEHHIAESFTFSASTAYTASIYIKQVYGSRNIRILFYTNSAIDQATVIFNPSTGAVVSAATASGSMTAVSATATLLGNGFWRFTLSGTTSATAGSGAVRYQMMSGTTASYTGDGWSSLFYWGAQLEALAFSTSYIATTSAQVTRAADVASMTGTNFSSWYNISEGTLYAESSSITTNTYAYIANLSDGGTGVNELALRIESANYGGVSVVSGVAQADMNIGSYVAGVSSKTIMVYKTNDFAGTKNGGTVATDTLGSLPTVNQLVIGTQRTAAPSTFTQTGTYKKIAYYPIRVTNAQLQALTGS
jgi:hypothetical protein